jgi:hypothetical protein
MSKTAGFFLVAQKLHEAATAMCHEDIRTRLRDALEDAYQGTGSWCYIVAVFGDDKAGDVVYSCNSDLKKAAYTMATGSTKVAIDTAVDVQPFTTYETETAEVVEAGRRNSSRDLKQLQSIHDAATGLGATCTKAKESNVSRETSGVRLVESATPLETITVREAKADYEIKLIAPGKGSSAFYPAEVLKRDGPKVFTEGTHVYLNHPTLAEEAARPEGDVANLAGVLSSGAVYYESHKNGPGLYGRMKVFADHAQTVEEKASHVGMSIRASGVAESGQMRDGVPVLKELTGAESVDIVTRAGAGGMILTEAARTAANLKQGADDMDAAELKKLNESLAAQTAINARLMERAVRSDAREAATKIVAGIELAEASRARVVENVLRDIPKTEAGELDAVKFAELVNQEAKREAQYVAELTGAGRVSGMGAGGGVMFTESDPVKAAEAAKALQLAEADDEKRAVETYRRMGMDEKAANLAAKGRAA